MINRQNLSRVVNFYLVASVIAAAYGLYKTIGYMAGIETGQTIAYVVPRLYGTATEPQVFGNFLLSCLPLVLCLHLMGRRGWVRWAVPLFILLLALVMTISIGAWAGMIGALLFIMLFVRRFTLKGVAAFLLIIVLISGVIWAVNRFAETDYLMGLTTAFEVKMLGTEPQNIQGTKNLLAVSDNRRSFVDRVWFREAAWNMFKDNPVIGVGTGNYGIFYNKYRSEGTPELAHNVKTHNDYLNILSETGIIGFAVFAAIIFTLLIKAFKNYFETGPENKTIIIGIVACLIGLGIHGYSFGILKHNYTWVLAGFLAATESRQDKLR
ncbi:MAG: O-antigen ligase family protein [Firmicutes bacterium]|nr:O-antigen ligase family protein [Bacillota bacterium]